MSRRSRCRSSRGIACRTCGWHWTSFAWALAGIGGKEPSRNAAFPIYLAPDDFHERTKKGRPTAGSGLAKIRTMPAEARRMIEELQPWHAEDPELHPLWTLNEYSRIDRHRTLSIIFALDDYSDAVVGRRSESGKFVHDPDMTANEVLSSGAFYDGAELFRFTLKEPEPNLEVQYESSPLYLSLGKAYETTSPGSRVTRRHPSPHRAECPPILQKVF